MLLIPALVITLYNVVSVPNQDASNFASLSSHYVYDLFSYQICYSIYMHYTSFDIFIMNKSKSLIKTFSAFHLKLLMFLHKIVPVVELLWSL